MAPKYQPLLENVQLAECGDLLTYEQADELGFDIRSRGKDVWMVDQLRKHLRNEGRALEIEKGKGYKVVCHDEAMLFGHRQARRGVRLWRRGAVQMANSAATGLFRFDQQKIEDRTNHMRRVADMASRFLRLQ